MDDTLNPSSKQLLNRKATAAGIASMFGRKLNEGASPPSKPAAKKKLTLEELSESVKDKTPSNKTTTPAVVEVSEESQQSILLPSSAHGMAKLAGAMLRRTQQRK